MPFSKSQPLYNSIGQILCITHSPHAGSDGKSEPRTEAEWSGEKKSAEVCSLPTESLRGLEQDRHLPGSQFLSYEVKESVEQLIESLSGYAIDESLSAIAPRNVQSAPLSVSLFVNDSEFASLEHGDESLSQANIFTKK